MKQPTDLPRRVDDGTASHLQGMPMPQLVLPATDSGQADLAALPGRFVIYNTKPHHVIAVKGDAGYEKAVDTCHFDSGRSDFIWLQS